MEIVLFLKYCCFFIDCDRNGGSLTEVGCYGYDYESMLISTVSELLKNNELVLVPQVRLVVYYFVVLLMRFGIF